MECYEAHYKRPHSGWCSAANCLNQRGTSSGISFFMFPASPERCKTWATNAGRPDLEKKAAEGSKTLRKNNALCEEHFHKDQFMCPAEKGVLNKRKRLMPKAIPTLFGMEAQKMTAANKKLEEPNTLKTGVNKRHRYAVLENTKRCRGEELIEALMTSECNSVMDPDILLTDLVASQETNTDSGSYSVMKATTESGDTYLAVPLSTNEPYSDKIVLNEIIAGDCLKCAEPLHSDASEVVKLKQLVREQIRLLQKLNNEVHRLNAIKKKYEKPEGIIKLASNYLEGEDLATFASKLRNSSKRKRQILTGENEFQTSNEN